MKDTGILINSFLLIFLDLAITFCWAFDSTQKHNRINELENRLDYLEYQNKQDKERYEREIDTCLDILENKRWN